MYELYVGGDFGDVKIFMILESNSFVQLGKDIVGGKELN
jgi:hypothetical protein